MGGGSQSTPIEEPEHAHELGLDVPRPVRAARAAGAPAAREGWSLRWAGRWRCVEALCAARVLTGTPADRADEATGAALCASAVHNTPGELTHVKRRGASGVQEAAAQCHSRCAWRRARGCAWGGVGWKWDRRQPSTTCCHAVKLGMDDVHLCGAHPAPPLRAHAHALLGHRARSTRSDPSVTKQLKTVSTDGKTV